MAVLHGVYVDGVLITVYADEGRAVRHAAALSRVLPGRCFEVKSVGHFGAVPEESAA